MDWISSLLNVRCPFCGERLGHPGRACEDCAREWLAAETAPVRCALLRDGIEARALLSYEGWARSLILRQKKQPLPLVARRLAELVLRARPAEWRALPLVWIPGKPLAEQHLTEAVALQLARLGVPLAPRAVLARRLRRARAQKELGLEERMARPMRELYRVRRVSWPSESREIVLLDDVVTTGATLVGCARLLEEELGLKVRGTLALALTEKR